MGNIAAFVMVRDEPEMLPVWLRYYTRFVNSSDIYIFDHSTCDGSIEEARRSFSFNLERLDHPVAYDIPWYTEYVKAKQKELLQSYQVVIFAEVDEILWCPYGLDKLLKDFASGSESQLRALGHELLHLTHEKPMNFGKEIVSQRMYWSRAQLFDKTLISKIPLDWTGGFHNVKGIEQPVDGKNLRLMHLHYADIDHVRKKYERCHSYRQKERPNRLAILKDWESYMETRFVVRLRTCEKLPAWVRTSLTV